MTAAYETIAPHRRPFGPHAVNSRFRLYIDEFGHHRNPGPKDPKPDQRYLGLVGVVVEQETRYPELVRKIDEFCGLHFPEDVADEDPPILHLQEIHGREGAFSPLNDPGRRHAFHCDLVQLISQAEFVAIAVVIDKLPHFAKGYRSRRDPYHYCLEVLLERYVGILEMCNATGDVMAEARYKEADQQLRTEFESIYTAGTRFCERQKFEHSLTSAKLKIKPKSKRIAGLQLADLVAYPLSRQVLEKKGRIGPEKNELRRRIRAAADPKLNRQYYTGDVEGYGEKFLV